MKISMKNSKNNKKGKQRTHAIWPPSSTTTPLLCLHVYKNTLIRSSPSSSSPAFPCDSP